MSSQESHIIPDTIYDEVSGRSYKKGRFFGKGGFAKCYEITDTQDGYVYAGKIVSKKLMTRSSQREKMTQEIAIHRSLHHKHVVGFHGFFEDRNNVYIVLELCRRRSMMELHKRRKSLTEPEVRYYLRQILLGVHYLHESKIIHRDLKLGNLFLNDNLEVKIGDFGLAAKIEFDGERKKTLCGTPNYIAPEILTKQGHSFEVDVWSIGCIMFTLLVGKPPFETSSLQETYSRIKKCDYSIPPHIRLSKPAIRLIKDMIQPNPTARPKITDLLQSEFFSGYIPSQLPISCLSIPPRFEGFEKLPPRKPLIEVSNGGDNVLMGPPAAVSPKPKRAVGSSALDDNRVNLSKLKNQLKDVLKSSPGGKRECFAGDELTDPDCQPVVWIGKWVDYSDKYGFGYQLNDEGVGVTFNDGTKLIMHPNLKNVQYILQDGSEVYYTSQEFPRTLEKKMKLLSYFRKYMTDHLVNTGGNVPVKEGDQLSRIPYLLQWMRTSSGVIMNLSNGTVQINFNDHTKIILCPLMAAVTYIDTSKSFLTYRFSTIQDHGCSAHLAQCLQFASAKIQTLLM